MGKYDLKIITNYVNGDDIDEYDIDELENDYMFMIKVIEFTNDKNFYNLCGEDVKNNYEFIKFMIMKFKDNIWFVCDVANEYLAKDREELYQIELLLIMCEITKNKDKDQYLKYSVMAFSFYSRKQIEIELLKMQEENDHKLIDEIGMGFWFIYDDFNSSEITLRFFTIRYLRDIVDRDGFSFEGYIHEKFASFLELERIGINNFLLDFIRSYDQSLYSYVVVHIDLLDELKRKLFAIRANWDNFEAENERLKYTVLLEQVHRYMEDNMFQTNLIEPYVLYHIGLELGIADKIRRYDAIDEESYQEIIHDEYFDPRKLRLGDYKHYCNVKKIMNGILSRKVVGEVDDGYSDYGEGRAVPGGGQIIEVDFSTGGNGKKR